MLGQFLTSLATNAIGSIFGMGVNAFNNEQAQQRESTARKENYEYGEKSAQNADRRTRALYNDLMSPKAMLSQYQEAGLSPSLMFGKGGAGGTTMPTGAQGTGAGGISPTSFAYSTLEGAEIAKTLAEARLMHVNADEKQGNTPLGEAQIAKLLADAGHANAAKTYTESLEVGQKIANRLADTSFNYSVDYYKFQSEEMKHLAEKTLHEAITAEVLAQVEKATIEAQIENAKLRNKELIANTALKWAQIKLTEQEKKESEQRMWNMIEEITIKWAEADAAERQAGAYEKWVDGKLPYLSQELELEAKRLKIENNKVWVEGTTNAIRAVADGIMVGSCIRNGGKSSFQAPDIEKLNKQYKRGGKATIGKGNMVYNDTYGF